jgi:hypothetical protein
MVRFVRDMPARVSIEVRFPHQPGRIAANILKQATSSLLPLCKPQLYLTIITPCNLSLQIYPRSQLIIFISIFYSVCSQHVSAPTGHPQVKHIIIIYIFMKNYHTTGKTIIPQHIRYFYNY